MDTGLYDNEQNFEKEDTVQEDNYIKNMNAEIKNGFIRKVYSILSLQLLVTFFVSWGFSTEQGQKFGAENPSFMIVVVVLYFVFSFTLICCKSVAQKSPQNYIFLFGFTVCLALMMGGIIAYTAVEAVFMAVVSTFIIFVGLTAYAFLTKSDFTGYGGYLLALLLALIVFGFLKLFFRSSEWMDILYASIGALIFSMYIVFDTQLMMIGSKKYTYSPDDYIMASLNLYLDVINLFLYLLQIFASAKKK